MMKYLFILMMLTFVLLFIGSQQTTEIKAQSQSGDDCDDLNFTINPGVVENESLCVNTVDDDCDGLIDCEDPSCAGFLGPNNHICCDDSPADCSAYTSGTCGGLVCTNRECFVQEDTSRCTTFGECGVTDGTCTPQPEAPYGNSSHPYNSFWCNYQDDHTACLCEEICSGPGGGFTCQLLPSNGCSLNYLDCTDAAQDPFREPTNASQCICHGLFETCGGP